MEEGKAEDVIIVDENVGRRALRMSNVKDFDPATFRAAINGVLEHELSVGDSTFIPAAARIPIPFSAIAQHTFALANGMSVADARLLTMARIGLLTWYSSILTSVDMGEAFPTEAFLKGTRIQDGKMIVRHDAATHYQYGTWIGNVAVELDSAEIAGVWYQGNNTDAPMFTEVSPAKILTHMKDVAVLVAMNLVRTQHHYQTNINQTFLAMEQKRFGKKSSIFTDGQRGIMYHDAIHPFTQTAKLVLYSKVLHLINNDALAADSLFSKLDGVVIKRVPVVPAGAAWLSAGISIMHEIVLIPGIGSKIPDDIKLAVVDAIGVLNAAKTAGKVDQAVIAKYAPLAAFAYGTLKEIAAEHSALRAPSLKKVAEQHVGIMTHASTIARNYLRDAR